MAPQFSWNYWICWSLKNRIFFLKSIAYRAGNGLDDSGQVAGEHAQTQVDDVCLVFFCLRIGIVYTVLSLEELWVLLGLENKIFFKIKCISVR